MSDYISVDSAVLRSMGLEFERASEDTLSYINEALARISLYDGVWGHDATGKAFETQYTQSRDGMSDGMHAIPVILKNFAGGVDSTANGYDKANDHAGNLVDDLNKGMHRKG